MCDVVRWCVGGGVITVFGRLFRVLGGVMGFLGVIAAFTIIGCIICFIIFSDRKEREWPISPDKLFIAGFIALIVLAMGSRRF